MFHVAEIKGREMLLWFSNLLVPTSLFKLLHLEGLSAFYVDNTSFCVARLEIKTEKLKIYLIDLT